MGDRYLNIQTSLLRWYRSERRDLPWRRQPTPYAVWVSEMMLQQTQVATVIPYFERWMRRFPDVFRLAEASEESVLHAFQGLGYYSRARNMRLAAQRIVREYNGELPGEVTLLRRLPGIGPYSAGAIASIAFGVPAPIVDGNVTRVLCRLFGLGGDPTKAPLKSRLWSLAAELVPAADAADFNQALMELGALICTPKQPRCASCPLRDACTAAARGQAERYPEPRPRPPPEQIQMAAALLRDGPRVLLVRGASQARWWRGLWQFPNAQTAPGETEAQTAVRAVHEASGVRARAGAPIAALEHTVTRYRIRLCAVPCRIQSTAAASAVYAELAWPRVEELEAFAMPAAHRKLADELWQEPT